MNLLEIEWRHLDRDGKTCDRCADTGETVREACEALSGELGPAGWEVRLRETLLTDREIGESNMILLNGTPAVVIDGEVKSVGKVPGKDEVKGWLKS